MMSNDNRISAAQIRVIGDSHFMLENLFRKIILMQTLLKRDIKNSDELNQINF